MRTILARSKDRALLWHTAERGMCGHFDFYDIMQITGKTNGTLVAVAWTLHRIKVSGFEPWLELKRCVLTHLGNSTVRGRTQFFDTRHSPFCLKPLILWSPKMAASKLTTQTSGF